MRDCARLPRNPRFIGLYLYLVIYFLADKKKKKKKTRPHIQTVHGRRKRIIRGQRRRRIGFILFYFLLFSTRI